MKNNVLKSIAMAATVATAATSVAAESYQTIRTEKNFRASIVDKSILGENEMILMIAANGDVSGSFNSGKFVGRWNWQGTFWCRNMNLNGKNIGTDCQKIEISGDQLRFTRNQGKGKASLYHFE